MLIFREIFIWDFFVKDERKEEKVKSKIFFLDKRLGGKLYKGKR